MTDGILHEDALAVGASVGCAFDALEGRTVLLSGGAGFLGAAMLDAIVALNAGHFARPARVVVVDNFVTGLPARLRDVEHDPNVRLFHADISQPFDLGEPFHFAVHAASIASPIVYRANPLKTLEVNVWGLRRMLDLAKSQADFEGFLLFSTSEIYGDPDPAHIPTAEDYRGYVSCTGPRACYDESKRFGETLAVVYRQEYGLPIRVVRPFNAYGAGQRLDDGRIIPDVIGAAVKGAPLVLFSDGWATRSFCYVSDCVAASFLALLRGKPGEAYNVGNDHEVSIREVAELVAALAKTTVAYQTSSDPHYLTDNPERRCPDIAKAREHLGYVPRVALREGLERTLRWAREKA